MAKINCMGLSSESWEEPIGLFLGPGNSLPSTSPSQKLYWHHICFCYAARWRGQERPLIFFIYKKFYPITFQRNSRWFTITWELKCQNTTFIYTIKIRSEILTWCWASTSPLFKQPPLPFEGLPWAREQRLPYPWETSGTDPPPPQDAMQAFLTQLNWQGGKHKIGL